MLHVQLHISHAKTGYKWLFSAVFKVSSAAGMDFTEVNFLCPFGCCDVDTSH